MPPRRKAVKQSWPEPTEPPTKAVKKSWPERAEPASHSASQQDPSKYRILFDEALAPSPLNASQLRIDDVNGKYRIHASVQHAGVPTKSNAVVGKGVGVYVAAVS